MSVKRLVLLCLLWTSADALASPDIQHWTLDNGVRVYFVEAHELPMLQISVVFDAGSARDPAGRSGLARMAAAMLKEGAGDRDADAIARSFEDRGAQFSASSERDMAALTLRSLSQAELLKPAVDVLRDILLVPTFPVSSLERERQRALVALRQDSESPAAVAGKAFFQALYGSHPYAHHPAGDEQGLKALTREELVQHHRDYYVGANAVLAMVGDLSPRRAKRLARRLAGQLPRGKPAAALPEVSRPDSAVEQRMAFPSTQTHLRLGQPGMHRKDPDYFPLYVGNHILGGGGLVSRLSEEIREKHGLSYSVYSYFAPMRVEGPFITGLQTRNAERDKALTLVRATLQEFVESGPTEDELVAAKKNLTGGFPLRIDSNQNIAEYLAVIGFYDLPLTYLDDFIPAVQAVTAAQIRDAFRRRIDPDKLVTVVVGGER